MLSDIVSDQASKARVMVDLLNEPDSHNLGYNTTHSLPASSVLRLWGVHTPDTIFMFWPGTSALSLFLQAAKNSSTPVNFACLTRLRLFYIFPQLMRRWEAVGPLYLQAMDVLYRVRLRAHRYCCCWTWHCLQSQHDSCASYALIFGGTCMRNGVLSAGQPIHAVFHPGFWPDQLWAGVLRDVLG